MGELDERPAGSKMLDGVADDPAPHSLIRRKPLQAARDGCDALDPGRRAASDAPVSSDRGKRDLSRNRAWLQGSLPSRELPIGLNLALD